MTVQHDPVAALRLYLQELPCPTCGGHELEPMLQCDYYPDGCLWLVRCESCRTSYHFDHRTVPGEEHTSHCLGRTGVHREGLTEQKGGPHANP